MNLPDRIHRFRKQRKMKRDKPHFWYLPHNKLGWIQNYKVGTNSIKHSLACNIMEQRSDVDTCTSLTDEQVAEINKQNSGFHLPGTIREKWADAYIFAFVRNPLDRLYSCYANKVLDIQGSGELNPFRHFGVSNESSFEDFVKIIIDVPDSEADRHFRTQKWFLSDDDQLITNYIGKIENLQEDWQVLVERFSLQPLPHKNKSSLQKTLYSQFYTPETWNLALKRYACDIELFGYEKTLAADHPSKV